MSAILFGKLPSYGDFVARGLEPGERQLLDDWLSAALTAAREAHDLDFDRRYRAAPPWRCVLPELCGWRGGALVPSLDSAGRSFPLLIAVGRSGPQQAAAAAQACEDAIYEAFDQGWTADRLFDHLARVPEGEQDAREGWWTEGNAEFGPQAIEGLRPVMLLTAMLQPAEQPA
jgi:type VI secretion system protein ImpM